MSETVSSIIDNRDGNTLLVGLQRISGGGREVCIATAFFSLDAFVLAADAFAETERIRILFGDDASPKQRLLLLQKLREKSDEDLSAQRENLPLLSPLKKVEKLFKEGRIEARCYTAKKFHAKAYFIARPEIFPHQMGIIGSGNFTRMGLTQNIELNLHLTPEQTGQLKTWFEDRWKEAEQDVVTEEILKEVRRQIELYDPFILYLKALYTWGQDQQVADKMSRSRLFDELDAHQAHGYAQALKIIERNWGVLICDGVGLGKSYIALALIEKFCRESKNVLLVAPKNILDSSWQEYLKEYLSPYRSPFGNIHEMAMTDFGFDGESEDVPQTKRALLDSLIERSDVIVIDESHNFRTTSANRYLNLYRIVNAAQEKRKKVILLTATPINTAYTDLSAQLALITGENGSIGSYSVTRIRQACKLLDRSDTTINSSPNLTLDLYETPNETLNQVLREVVIQRSRKTCKELSEAAGKILRFPKRKDPQCLDYEIKPINPAYHKLIELAYHRFQPGVLYIEQLRAALKAIENKEAKALPPELAKGQPQGIKLAAFLLEQYRFVTEEGSKTYQDEVRLAELVFTNTLKQLESSLPAFQGMIQSLGLGLLARLKQVFGMQADSLIKLHEAWVRTPLFTEQEPETAEALSTDEATAIQEGESLDASGEETENWLKEAIRTRGLTRKLENFKAETYDVEKWKEDIICDLVFLKEIHEAVLAAKRQPDPKLETIFPSIENEIRQGNRVLVFTQSQRTSRYLERELKKRLPDYGVARIDSTVEKTRPAVLYAFCPGYNRYAVSASVPERIDVLISTDVLSEGVNLQEAGVILNYDIHWNPVRLIQRIGRVDRRLNPLVTPEDHEFAIYNVLPPNEINRIIELVETVDNRKMKISRTLGIDVSFFKSDDPAGNLREFNAMYEGDVSSAASATIEYVRHFENLDALDETMKKALEELPPGAFGVWGSAPVNGVFALFRMEAKATISESDREKFASIIGRPLLILEADGKNLQNAAEILTLLKETRPGEQSVFPSDEAQLSARLKRLKNTVRQQFNELGLPATILPKLVCWMELRKGA